MKDKKLLIIVIPILLLIPVMIAVHTLGNTYAQDTRVFIGVLGPTAFLLIFGTLLLIEHSSHVKTEEILISVLGTASEAVYGLDLMGKCTFVNKSCVELLGYESESDLIGKNMHTLIHHSYRDGKEYPAEQCPICIAVNEGRESSSDQEAFWKADGTSFLVDYRLKPQIIRNKTKGAVIIFMDITDRKEAEERIKYLSYHDPVTGLYNQTFMYEELKRLDVERNLPFSVIVGDVNGLKLTNDIFGHEEGDILLKKISQAIAKSCRADDIIARVGGDEFTILLPNTSNEDVVSLIERIHDEVEQVEYQSIKGSISLGKATKIKIEDDFKEILKEAEQEMYQNKSLNQKDNNIDQLQKIIQTLHVRSDREKIHSANVSDICVKIATNLKLSSEEIRRVKDAGYYHDIGKVVLDDEILNKIGDLDEEETTEMKRHTIVGYRILGLFDGTVDIAKGALDHHEHWDGSGYPKGLKGDEISLLGRIVAVAEAYDFRRNPHSNVKLSKVGTTMEIKDNASIKFDPEIVDAFLQIANSEDLG